MRLPLLISVPHGGLQVPEIVGRLCILSQRDIVEDGDEGAAEIYGIQSEVMQFVRTDVARAIVDVNRAEDDRGADGVIKTHTAWGVPVYGRYPSAAIIEKLLQQYYRPYHAALSRVESGILLGIDCHTMAAKGPPVGPGPGVERPAMCLSNADTTCPDTWVNSLAECLELPSGQRVSINDPFKGGYTIRSHANELPWIQLELSRAPFASNREKREFVLRALRDWCNSLI